MNGVVAAGATCNRRRGYLQGVYPTRERRMVGGAVGWPDDGAASPDHDVVVIRRDGDRLDPNSGSGRDRENPFGHRISG